MTKSPEVKSREVIFAALKKEGIKLDRYSAIMLKHFAYEMEGRSLGPEALLKAFHWFRAGWHRCRTTSE